MTILESIVLGVVQGVTEFLPISSTAHLILVPWVFHWPDPGLTFDVELHAGTLLAIVAYFWKDWRQMFSGFKGLITGKAAFSGPENRLLWLVVLGTIPAAVIGVVAEKAVESWLRSPFIISGALIGLALVLAWAEKISRKDRPLSNSNLADSVTVGCAQALAVVPGVSRSGVTMTAGLFRGLTREAAARFSFLLSAPIIAGAGLKKALELRHAGIDSSQQIPMLAGFFASFLAGYLTIRFLLKYLRTHSLKVFVIYRIALGAIILFLIYFAGFQP
jgi:undecaprenyl-diphosphatase